MSYWLLYSFVHVEMLLHVSWSLFVGQLLCDSPRALERSLFGAVYADLEPYHSDILSSLRLAVPACKVHSPLFQTQIRVNLAVYSIG